MSIEVSIHNHHRCIRPAHESLRRLAHSVFRRERKRGSVTVILASAHYLRSLNRQYRGKMGTTDVLSFPFGENGKPDETGLWGELYLNLDYLSRMARKHHVRLRDEIALRIVHGLLHLFGFDHQREGDAATMAAHERRLLAAATFNMPPWEAQPAGK